MPAIFAAIIALLGELAPAISTASMAAKVVDMLMTLVPAVVHGAPRLWPVLKSIIGTVKGSAHITPEQVDQIDLIEAKADGEFDDALAKAEAEDAAAAKG